jgi:hypothetical protein
MESQKSWYELKVSNKNALKQDWKFPSEPFVQGQWTFQSKDIFNPEWIEYCKSKGIHLLGDVMLFYKAPLLNSHRAHVDITESTHTTWALNWTIDNNTSTMYWYDTPSDDIEKLYPIKDSRYIEWDTRALTLLDEKNIEDSIVLCRVDIPHSIKVGKQPRWCISARAWLGDEPMPKWTDVVSKLEQMELI